MLLTLMRLGRTFDAGKNPEFLLLWQQLGILQRKQNKPIKPNRVEQLTFAVLAAGLKTQTNQPVKQYRNVIRIF